METHEGDLRGGRGVAAMSIGEGGGVQAVT